MTDQNLQAVRNLADAYITATFEGDAETFKKIFDDSAVMNGYLNGELMKGSPEPFIQQMASTPSLKSGGAPYEASIEHIDANDVVGSFTIKETGFGPMSFTNYFHALKENDEWKIVSKTFVSS